MSRRRTPTRTVDAAGHGVAEAAGGVVPALALVLALGACAAPGPEVREAPPRGTPAGESGDDAAEGADAGRPVLVPARDADRDRVGDAVDDCPDSAPDEIVDDTGCPLFERVLEGVVFAPGDHRLGAESRLALEALVNDLEAHPEVVLRLEGHTDNRGTAVANLELSKRRVLAVARVLVAEGIASERLRPYGFGESRPRAGNSTESGRERNRRIEIGRERDDDEGAEDTAGEP